MFTICNALRVTNYILFYSILFIAKKVKVHNGVRWSVIGAATCSFHIQTS